MILAANAVFPPESESESRSVLSDCNLRHHGLYSSWTSQARILEWVALPFSKGSSQPRDRTQVSCVAGSFFTIWATRETYYITWSYSSAVWGPLFHMELFFCCVGPPLSPSVILQKEGAALGELINSLGSGARLLVLKSRPLCFLCDPGQVFKLHASVSPSVKWRENSIRPMWEL